MATRALKITTWNANGLRNKTGELKVFLYDTKPDVMTITETKLMPTDKIKIKNYDIVRNDRDDVNRGGGVLLLIKTGIPYKITKPPNTKIEAAVIVLPRSDLTIVATYNKPRNYYKEKDLKILLRNPTRTIIAGDLNSKHPNWSHGHNTNGNTLKKFLEDDNTALMNFPDTPTHFPANGSTPTTIDGFIVKNVRNFTRAITLDELNSDHIPVTMQIRDVFRDDVTRTIVDYSKTNWPAFRRTLDEKIDINNNINTQQDIETETEKLTQAITKATEKHTKKITLKNGKETIPQDITNKIKERNKRRRLLQRTGLVEHRNAMKTLNAEIRTALTNHNNKRWRDTLKKLNIKDNTLWKMAKAMKKKRQTIPPLATPNGEAVTDAEKAEAMATHFAEVHKDDRSNNSNSQHEIETNAERLLKSTKSADKKYVEDMKTNKYEIWSIISKMQNTKAPGEDGILNKVLKNLSRKAIIKLVEIINAMFKHNYYPKIFKTAIVTAILKPNKNKSDVKNYRPISLLSNLSKIIEKVIHRRLQTILTKQKIEKKCQFGFKKGHNTTLQLVRIVHDIILNYNKSKTTVMTLLDMEKAFDKLWIAGLIEKMSRYKINENFIRLTGSYLSGRKLKVRINNAISTEKDIEAGVPQGSILGPALYSLYLTDLPEFEKTTTALYADDTALYAHSFYATAAQVQNQLHINKLIPYFAEWKMKVNKTKTEQIIFTRKRTNTKPFSQLKIDGHPVQPEKVVRYLGLQLDTRLNFKHHIKTTVTKGNAAIRILYPLLARNSANSDENKLIVYKQIIRPLITYGAPVWGHSSNYTMEPLEIFQNKCMRLITGASRFTRIRELQAATGLPPIKNYIRDHTKKFFASNWKNEFIRRIREEKPEVIRHKGLLLN